LDSASTAWAWVFAVAISFLCSSSRLGPIALGLRQLLLERLLPRLHRTQHRRPGEPLEHRQENQEHHDGPEHEAALDGERAGRMLFLRRQGRGRHQEHGGEDEPGQLLHGNLETMAMGGEPTAVVGVRVFRS
jgi:hypothetical protein